MRYRTVFTTLAAAVTVATTAVVAATLAAGAPPTRWSAAPGAGAPSPEATPASPPATASPSATPAPSGSTACPPNPWDCAQQRRFAAAEAYLRDRPGKLGVVIGDRGTGAVWRAGATTDTTWTASTIKLAIATTVLEWQREQLITMDDTDRANLHAALVNSDNDAATTLWARYGGQPMFDRFRTRYGMTGLSVVPGYELFWRNLRCSAEDLYHLMAYVLTSVPLDDRAYLVGELRGVASNQRWGVWAAGPGLRPGNKDGWAQKPDSGGMHWVVHTVGFAGPSERYVVAVMYSMPPSGTMTEGIQTVSDLVATAFGAPVPARVSTP